MKKITITDNQNASWTRVSKAVARKAYNAGAFVTFVPCKLHPFGNWNPSSTLAGSETSYSFDELLPTFRHFNCTNETGNYISFYTKA